MSSPILSPVTDVRRLRSSPLAAWIQKGLDPARAYGPYIEEGEPMPSIVLGRVIASKSPRFEVGSRAQAFSSWQEFPVFKDAEAQQIESVPRLLSLIYPDQPTLTGLLFQGH